MKRRGTALALILAASALTLPSIASAEGDLIEITGCVYNQNTGETVPDPFVVRVFTDGGIGIATLNFNGCYDQLMVSPDAAGWEFVEVLYRFAGKLYTEQKTLPPNASPIGFDFLGTPENTVRYDFFLDILDPE